MVVTPYQWKIDHCKCDSQMESYQQELLESTLCIVNFAIQSGTILERWINATNILIPKKNGSYKVTDYRYIHIYECDMNAMLSLKWKELLKQSFLDFMKYGITFAKEIYIEHLSLSGIRWDIIRVQELHQTLGYNVLPTKPIKLNNNNGKKLKKVKNMLRSNEMSYLEAETLYLRIYLLDLRYFLPFMSLPVKIIKDITKQNIALLLRK
jgi:hypothetical protein